MILQLFFTLVFETNLSLHLNIIGWLGELASEPQRSACLGPHLPSLCPAVKLCAYFSMVG